MRLVLRLALSALSAVLMVLSVPTFDWWPLMWIGLLPALHVALTAATPRRAFFQGWFTGILANTAAFYWMKGLLERFGHMPGIEAIPIMMLLTTYQGLEFGLWSWLVHRLARRRPSLPMAWAAPLVMVAIELLVPQIFPFYLAISQAWVPHVIQIADLTGPMGVTFMLVMVTGALYDAWRAVEAARASAPGAVALRAALPALRLPAALVALVLLYGVVRIHQIDARRAAAPKARVGIVQANIGISEKWDPNERGRLLRLHQELSSQLSREGTDLIVWPESSYPYAVNRSMSADYPPGDPRRIRGPNETTPTIFGAVTLDMGPRVGKARYPWNTALMMDESGRLVGKFDKVFLLIFGEYIPFYDSIPWFTELFPEASNFNRGDSPGSFPFHLDGHDYRLGPLICYEDILPGFTRRTAALDPNLLVNITNDAWFGKTFEPYQHLALAVFRSVENRLEMVRSVNTGVSAHIDAVGRVRASLGAQDPASEPPPEPMKMRVEAALLDRGGLYAAIGDLFAWGCTLALAALLFGMPGRLRKVTPRVRRRRSRS
ncbi:MAG TPA: apolipoprotein N-acyltransferase [Polyangia bacterium]|jgi:apolipoprotein N-acyltransferase